MSVSTLGDKRIKEITSLQRKVILGFRYARYVCLSPDGYAKSLIYQLAVRVAAELSVVYNNKTPERVYAGCVSLRMFARKFSNIDFFLRFLPLKVDELLMSEM